MNLPLIPAPAAETALDGTLLVDETLVVVAQSAELADVAAHFVEDVRIDAGIALTVASRGIPSAGHLITLRIETAGLDAVAPAAGLRADGKATAEGADERYGLEITDQGVQVWGPTAEAVHRGLTSLRQLIAARAHDGGAVLEAARILDGPRFAWRGFSLDVARTFHSTGTVRRVIDMCSLYKLNVLHLHLTDDQGWRIEVPSRPALTKVGGSGAFGDRAGGFYTQADMAALVAYAAERFVTVVPEIDMPGHCAAVLRSYPELAPAQALSYDSGNGSRLELGSLDPGREATWGFVADVLDAVVRQFPHSAYIHIGGDEAFGMPDQSYAAFVDRTIALVRSYGKRVVGWQEIARASVGPDEVAQYWMEDDEIDSAAVKLADMVPPELLSVLTDAFARGKKDLSRALGKGCRLLLSPASRLYLDRPHADASSDAAQEEARRRLGLTLASPTPLRDGVEWDPVKDTPGVVDDAQIAGVEAAIWCETLADRAELELMLLPRLGGAAEKAWATQTPTDWTDYAARLGRQSPAWKRRGWAWLRSVDIDWA